MLLYTQTIEDPRQAQLFEDVYTACRGRLLARARRKLLQRAKAALRQELEKEGLTV